MLEKRTALKFDGDRIEQASIRWGANDRPLWKTLESLDLAVAVKWADRFSAYEAISAEWCMAGAIEKANNIICPPRAEFLRTIYAEIQRLLWCFQYLGKIFKILGDEIRYQQCLKLREQIFECQEVLTGSRILPQIFCIGGLERDLSIGEKRKLKALLRTIEYEFRIYFRDLSNDLMLMTRMKGLLPISKKTAVAFSIFGPAGQASGATHDLRSASPYGVYDKFTLTSFDRSRTVDWFSESVVRSERGDGLSRMRSVFFQIRQSLGVVDSALEQIAEGPIVTKFDTVLKMKSGIWIFGVESGSGPAYGMFNDGKIRIMSHSLRMTHFLEKLLLGLYADDFELAAASLGIDFSQADLCGSY